MEFIVWVQDEIEGWKKVDCGDLEAAKREVLEAVKGGHDTILTMTLQYKWNIEVEEVPLHETRKSKTREDKSTRDEGDS